MHERWELTYWVDICFINSLQVAQPAGSALRLCLAAEYSSGIRRSAAAPIAQSPQVENIIK